MTDEELKKLIESNARAIQAMLDERTEARLEREELREAVTRLQENMVNFQDAVIRLVNVQEGMAKMLVSLDDDRPTILRRLMSIENKVDRLLEKQENDEQ